MSAVGSMFKTLGKPFGFGRVSNRGMVGSAVEATITGSKDTIGLSANPGFLNRGVVGWARNLIQNQKLASASVALTAGGAVAYSMAKKDDNQPDMGLPPQVAQMAEYADMARAELAGMQQEQAMAPRSQAYANYPELNMAGAPVINASSAEYTPAMASMRQI